MSGKRCWHVEADAVVLRVYSLERISKVSKERKRKKHVIQTGNLDASKEITFFLFHYLFLYLPFPYLFPEAVNNMIATKSKERCGRGMAKASNKGEHDDQEPEGYNKRKNRLARLSHSTCGVPPRSIIP